MDRRSTGLFFISIALLIWCVGLPEMSATGPTTNAAHLLAGFLLGIGVAMTVHDALRKRNRVQR